LSIPRLEATGEGRWKQKNGRRCLGGNALTISKVSELKYR